MKLSNLPNSEFKFYERSFYASLFDKMMLKSIVTDPIKATLELEQEFKKLGEKLGEKQVKIIYFMEKDKFITIIKLSDKLNISTTAIEKDIKKLSRFGLIKRVGSAKGGYWEVIE